MGTIDNDIISCDKIKSFNSDEICYADEYFIQNKNKIVVHKKTNIAFKAQRTLFKTLQFNNNFYIIDKSGDCYKVTIISNDIILSFIFGVLSQPKSFSISNNFIDIEDGFNRIYTIDLDGNLQNIMFLV